MKLARSSGMMNIPADLGDGAICAHLVRQVHILE